MRDNKGFLHRHPRTEEDYDIPNGHVLVDYDDWQKARDLHLNEKKEDNALINAYVNAQEDNIRLLAERDEARAWARYYKQLADDNATQHYATYGFCRTPSDSPGVGCTVLEVDGFGPMKIMIPSEWGNE